MLVLSRRQNEVIRIGDDIVIKIIALQGDKVRLGIEAPANVPVHRDEVYQAILKERREKSGAAHSADGAACE